MIKVFLTGDNHIGLNKKEKDIYENRINVLESMVKQANNEECDLFVIAGDLFEKNNNIRKGDLNKVLGLLNEFNNTVVLLPGNHDYYDADSDLWSEFNEIKDRYSNVLILNEYREYPVNCQDSADVILYPGFCKSKHSNEGENNIDWIKDLNIEKDNTYRIGIAHGAVEGETIDNGEYFCMSRKELNSLPMDLWLIGHTHVPFPNNLNDELTITKETVFNAGTHVQTDVNCNSEGYCFVIEIDDKKILKAKKYNSGNIFYKRLIINVKPGELEKTLNSELKKLKDNTIIDLYIKGTVNDEEYEKRNNIIDKAIERFDSKSTYSTSDLSRLITKEYINSKYPETSFSAKLLTALLKEPKETQLMDELLKSLKEGK